MAAVVGSGRICVVNTAKSPSAEERASRLSNRLNVEMNTTISRRAAFLTLAVLLNLSACDPPPERTDAPRERVPGRVTESSPCDLQTARNLGGVYRLTFPDIERAGADDFGVEPPSKLVSLIAKVPAEFSGDSRLIVCAKAFGDRAVLGTANAYDASAEERAVRMWGPGMPTQLPGEVTNSIQQGALDLYALGREMLWLSNVLPAAAAGNWRPYLETGTPSRQASRQAMPYLKLMISIDPQSAEVLRQSGQLLRQTQPAPEDQVVFLALALGVLLGLQEPASVVQFDAR